MNIYERFKMDEKRTQDGVWYDIDLGRAVRSEELDEWLTDNESSGLLIARLGTGNKQLLKAMASHKTGDTISMENARLLAEGCVRTWRGPAWVDEGGAPVEFSIEACTKVLTDLPELLTVVLSEAQSAANYRIGKLKEQSKN